MIKLRNILFEIKLMDPKKPLIYNVYVQYDERLDNNFFVKAFTNEQAEKIVMDHIGTIGPNGEFYGEIGDELTGINVVEVEKDDEVKQMFKDHLNNRFSDRKEILKFLNDPKSVMYCWDSGT